MRERYGKPIRMSSFALYLIGMVVLILGVSYGAYLAHVPPEWVVAIALVLLGFGILGAAKMKRPPNSPPPL